MSETLAPKDALTLEQAARLQTDNHSLKHSWCIIDGATVSIVKQEIGESPSQEIVLSRREFEAFSRWYRTPQKMRPE